ncbi:MAG: hypothetical protein AB1546_07000 [bacterium]
MPFYIPPCSLYVCGCAAGIGTRSSHFGVRVFIFIFYPNYGLRIPNYDSGGATTTD